MHLSLRSQKGRVWAAKTWGIQMLKRRQEFWGLGTLWYYWQPVWENPQRQLTFRKCSSGLLQLGKSGKPKWGGGCSPWRRTMWDKAKASQNRRNSRHGNWNVARVSEPWEPSELENFERRAWYAPGMGRGVVLRSQLLMEVSCCVTSPTATQGVSYSELGGNEGIVHKSLKEIRVNLKERPYWVHLIGWTLKERPWGRTRWTGPLFTFQEVFS